MSRLFLDIVTAERRVFSGSTDLVTVSGALGELTILPSHAPLFTQLLPGTVRIVTNKDEEYIFISGGFMEVLDNNVTVLANAAEPESEIDLERALDAERRAQKRLETAGTDISLERAIVSLSRARVRIKLARHGRVHHRERPTL